MWREYGFSSTDVFAQRTSLNFVDSVWEIFGALIHGARVSILPARLEHDPAGIVHWLVDQGISHLVTVPSLLAGILAADKSQAVATCLHTVICSGERLSPVLAQHLHSQWSGCRLLNTYGTSETWDGSCYLVPDNESEWLDVVPIGKPVANASLYILDMNQQPVPPGMTGELYIGGLALAKAYISSGKLTGEHFLPNPFSHASAARMYRSGDLARYRASGDVELLGRVDRQIKLRGLRIEAGEIESLAVNFSGVRSCALVLRESDNADPWLALFVVTDKTADAGIDIDALRTYLQQNLPRAMVPADICVLDNLPLTPSGKLDTLALPETISLDRANDSYVAARDETEQQLVAIWTVALGVERVGIFDDFFALRGHSLLATKVIARICDVCGVELPLQTMFETPTVAGLARSIEALRWTQDGHSGAAGTGSGDDGGSDANNSDREVVRL
jgi:acyl-coenzyme A synthetase/AMP-(fatty) acid ligase